MKSTYLCQNCGADFAKWLGQCVHCREWGSIKEIKLRENKKSSLEKHHWVHEDKDIVLLKDITPKDIERISSGIQEFDRVLGGGIVKGSAILIGGSPGAGKSTMLLQISHLLSQHKTVLYASGEESSEQIALHGKRLHLKDSSMHLLNSSHVEQIIEQSQSLKCDLLVIDSIQVMRTENSSSSPGSVSQVRECATALVRFAKQTGTIIIMVGHINKEGSLAGPKVLEHIVDCSLLLSPMTNPKYKSLRSIKNRFGATGELSIFATKDTGIVGITNPSAIFLSHNDIPISGSIATATWEGSRAILVEIQALVDDKGSNKRVVVGMDIQRIHMLIAVLSKYGKISCYDCDIFANIVGGIKIEETAADLPLMLAITSSMNNNAIPTSTLCFGEVGLSGELRPVPNGQERLQEAVKHGFTQAIIPLGNKPPKAIKGLKIMTAKHLSDVLNMNLSV